MTEPPTFMLHEHLTVEAALDRAFEMAAQPVPPNPNPHVGCVILDAEGRLVGVGAHRGAGTDHAEVVALAQAGSLARAGTAVVTLEPCNHIGRTGSCAQALIDAGIASVFFAVSDPADHGGQRRGAEQLAAAGVHVVGDMDPQRGRESLGSWLFAIEHGRPFVTWKAASSADGFMAPSDRRRLQLTGGGAVRAVHLLRSRVGAVVTGTGTVAADDPLLTARDDSGQRLAYQPLRVVIGLREVPEDAAIRGDDGLFIHLRTRDLAAALAELVQRGIHHVLLECGPHLASAFLAAGCVDEVLWFTADATLGSGLAVAGFPAPTLGLAPGWSIAGVDVLGSDTRHTLLPES